MAQNVTYLIGAGASAKALPVVSNWNHRLEQFSHFLFRIDTSYLKEKGIEKDVVIAAMNNLLKEGINHATIDTYAKKLFLKNSHDSIQKLLSLKHLLVCFFAFEQIRIRDFHSWYTEDENRENKSIGYQLTEDYEGQREQIDKRYDVFLATLLKSNTLCLDKRVNIISWNYDLQLELAYYDYNNNENPHTKLKVYPNGYGNNKNGSRIIKLNGTAGLFGTTKGHETIVSGTEGVYFPELDVNFLRPKTRREITPPSLISLLYVYSNFLSGQENMQPIMSFAWEKDEVSIKAVSLAKRIMTKTETLVIIGYSFPNFNRSIDKQLLQLLPLDCKVYYQDHKDRIEGLIQRLNGLLRRKHNMK